MKTTINNEASEKFEFIKRIVSSFQVLVIGLLIPFLFLVGINTNYGDTSSSESVIGNQHKKFTPKATADNTISLSDQHS